MDLSDAENQTLLEDLLSKLGGSTLQSDWQQQADAKTGAPYYWNAKVCPTDSASCIPSLGAISRMSSRLCLQTGETKWEKPVFEGAKQMTFEQLKVAINNHSFYKMQDGRHFVLLSLAEAESVRGNLHLSVSTGMPNSGAAQIALRMVRHCLVPANRRSALAARSLATDGRMLQVPADGVILDCSANYQQTKCVLAWGGLDRAAGAVFGFRTWPSSIPRGWCSLTLRAGTRTKLCRRSSASASSIRRTTTRTASSRCCCALSKSIRWKCARASSSTFAAVAVGIRRTCGRFAPRAGTAVCADRFVSIRHRSMSSSGHHFWASLLCNFCADPSGQDLLDTR